jgi:hypothetical protein
MPHPQSGNGASGSEDKMARLMVKAIHYLTAVPKTTHEAMALGFTLAFSIYLSNPNAPPPYEEGFSRYRHLLEPAPFDEIRKRVMDYAWESFMRTGHGGLLLLPSLFRKEERGGGEDWEKLNYSAFIDGFVVGYIQVRNLMRKG